MRNENKSSIKYLFLFAFLAFAAYLYFDNKDADTNFDVETPVPQQQGVQQEVVPEPEQIVPALVIQAATPAIIELYPAATAVPTLSPAEKERAVSIAISHVELVVEEMRKCAVRQVENPLVNQHCENYQVALKNVRAAADQLIREVNER